MNFDSAGLSCPVHPGRPLDRVGADELACPACGAVYPIRQGICCFFNKARAPESAEDLDQAAAMEKLWPEMAQAASSIIAVTESDAIQCALGSCTGRTVLDVGCGAGQPVETFAGAQRIFALDFSTQALRHYRAPCGTDVVRVHSTAVGLPFPGEMFDVVVAAQLLPHLRPGQRAAALGEIARVIKPDGRVIVTALHYNFRFPKLGMAKTGTSEGVYFFRHTVEEFRREIEPFFEVSSLWGVWNYLPKTYRLFMALGRKTLYWDRIVRRTALSLHYGKQLLAIGRLRKASGR